MPQPYHRSSSSHQSPYISILYGSSPKCKVALLWRGMRPTRSGQKYGSRCGSGAQIGFRLPAGAGMEATPLPRPRMPYKHNEPCRHKNPKARYRVFELAGVRPGSATARQRNRAGDARGAGGLGAGAGRAPWSSIGILGHRNQNRSHAAPLFQMLGLDLPVPDKTTPARPRARLPLATALKKPKGPVNVVIDSSGLKIFRSG